MKLEQLTYVVEVANTHSISQAASNLLISQPGLSSSLKQLENELGGELFVRNSKGVELTEMGRNFLIYAKRILRQVSSLEKICKNDTPPAYESLSVASFFFRFAGAVSAMMINKYKKEGTKFVVRNGNVGDCIDWVTEGICDVGIVCFRATGENEFKKEMQRKQLKYGNIYQAPMHIIIGSGHPLYYTDATEITPKELEKYTVLSRDQVNAKDYARSAYLYSDVTIGKQTDLRVIITDQAALYEMLEFTDCYCAGFSSDVVYQNVPGPHNLRNLTIIDGKEPIMMNVAWIAPANMEFMPLVKEYIQLITDVCTRKDFWELHPELKLNMHENF